MPANPSAGIGAQRNTNYVIQQRTAARGTDPRFSSQTSVVNVNGTPITNRRDQVMLGEKYSPNANAVSRFDRAAARIASRDAQIVDRAAARIAGRTAGTRAEQAQAQPYLNVLRNARALNYLNTPNIGAGYGGFGNMQGGMSWDANSTTYWSAPRLR